MWRGNLIKKVKAETTLKIWTKTKQYQGVKHSNNKTDAMHQRVQDSAYKRVIHKEERDIVHEPKHSFQKMYEDFQNNLRTLRDVINQIHLVNHKTTVSFKDE